MIAAEPNFISQKECQILLDYARNVNNESKWGWDADHPYWVGRSLSFRQESIAPNDYNSKQAYEILAGIQQRIRGYLISTYGLDEVYSDTFQLVRWPKGLSQPPHADAESNDGGEHPYNWRRYASIIYLNNDYKGGNTYFPQHEIAIMPTPLLLATFPGTAEFLHGVSEIEEGTRYTIAGFWCFDKSFADEFSK